MSEERATPLQTLKQAYDMGYQDGYEHGYSMGDAEYPRVKKVGWFCLGLLVAAGLIVLLGSC